MSTWLPPLLPMSVEPAVMALSALAGDALHASVFELPPATTMTMPASTAASVAWLSAVDLPPPSDMLPVAFLPLASFDAHWMPPTTEFTVPPPLAESTLTPTSSVFLAMPHTLPPTVDATCVPWPLPSVSSLSMVLVPQRARSSKSWCCTYTPVSMMYDTVPSPLLGLYSNSSSSGSSPSDVRAWPHDTGESSPPCSSHSSASANTRRFGST
mmetsp:Transcript_48671/g.119114  ORF Transcript_48671/g.119114 Transcript_48671/m.119114 type:complete len:212 (-) Transcript_48671:379-1014(-)